MALFGKNPEYREIIINNFTKLLNYYVAVSKKTITESFKKELAEATEVSIKTGSNLLKKELLLLNIKNKNLEKRFFEIEYLSDLKNEIYKLEFRRDLIFKSVWFRLWKMYSTIKL